MSELTDEQLQKYLDGEKCDGYDIALLVQEVRTLRQENVKLLEAVHREAEARRKEGG